MSIEFINTPANNPYLKLREYYDEALNKNQKNIDAISISSYDETNREISSRFVNLKYINNEEWIFFSNYNSSKARDFDNHNQISTALYWNSIDVQIRTKAYIAKASKNFSDLHFSKRGKKKNALARSSRQSEKINSFEDVMNNYKNALKNENNIDRPDFWGGYSFTPYLIEFWEGNISRVNKRLVYKKNLDFWENYYLQP